MKLTHICRRLVNPVVRKCNLSGYSRISRLSSRFCSSNDTGGNQQQAVAGSFNLKPDTCYYKILNLDTGAKNSEIKQSFQKLVKKFHPDVNPDPKAIEIYRKVTEAYDVLADHQKRKIYDEAIGVTDEFYSDDYAGANTNRRMWNYRHQQILEEELKRSMENPMPWRGENELNQYLENSAKAADEALIQMKKEQDLAIKNSKDAEPPYVVDGVKQDPEVMYQYFKNKYIKNPDIETRNPDEQLDFSWKLHNKTQKRVVEARQNYYEFVAGSDKGSYFVEKSSEDKIISPAGSALSHSSGFIVATVLTMGALWLFLSQSYDSASKDVVASKKVMRGEGISQKIVPI
jgi:curved DNA-binding protein CbpA